MYNLFVHMPIWGRSAIVGMVVQHWEHIRKQLEGQVRIWPFAIVSPGDPDPMDLAYLGQLGWGIIHANNSPLGAKWNKGWEAIGDTMIPGHSINSAFMQMGSDNLVGVPYIMAALARIRMAGTNINGVDHVALDKCFFINSVNGETVMCTAGGKWGYGPARMFSLKAMNGLNFKPYLDKKNGKMDAQVDRRLEAINAVGCVLPSVAATRMVVVDIKGPGSKNTWDAARQRRILSNEWKPQSHGLIPLLFPHLNWPDYMMIGGDENEG